MARVSESRMSIRCLYSITIWPLAITFFPRRNARDDDNWGRLINSYRNWVDGSAIPSYQLNSQTLPLVTLKAKSLRKCSKGKIFFGNFKILQTTITASGAEFLELWAYIVFRSNFSSYILPDCSFQSSSLWAFIGTFASWEFREWGNYFYCALTKNSLKTRINTWVF